ncbi:hypothetical protein PIB30_014242 [Stylosanthes scabra]|uniref:Uncharacterized protein n=1 Tax=Stylosanthes scabra TaxID=79078 RepID=A0ABU6X8I6_9FABA|nr:hypothetical protein [Stylosanthes scabra]
MPNLVFGRQIHARRCEIEPWRPWSAFWRQNAKSMKEKKPRRKNTIWCLDAKSMQFMKEEELRCLGLLFGVWMPNPRKRRRSRCQNANFSVWTPICMPGALDCKITSKRLVPHRDDKAMIHKLTRMRNRFSDL